VATVLARTRGRGGVLLLDLDFARARQADLFATAPAPGLADYLEGREWLRAVRGGPGQQLWLIPAGNHLGDPLRLIQVITMDDLLSVFRERFQWIVLDLPPLLSNPEVAKLAGKVDWHVIVGRHRRTAVADLRLVRELLGGDERPAGFLLTDDTTRVPEWIRRRL
jgi:Mrp family chromosome partitioning ATPase